MAQINALTLGKKHFMAASYGNVAAHYAKISVPVGAAIADTLDFMRIPKNVLILDFVEMHDGGNSAATTANFGLAAVPGGKTTQADADFFLAAADLNAAGRNRWGNAAVAPLITDDEYFLRAVLAGADTATAAMDIHVILYYEFLGNL